MLLFSSKEQASFNSAAVTTHSEFGAPDLHKVLDSQRFLTHLYWLSLPSVQFSCSVMSNSLQTHGLQHTGLPCPSSTPRAWSNSCPSTGDTIKPSHPLSSPSSPAFNLSQNQGLFKWVSSWQQVDKVLSFTISLSNEHAGLISFRMDWFYLLAVQEILKRLLWHHSSKASILQCSAFFIVQLSHSYMTRWTLLAK